MCGRVCVLVCVCVCACVRACVRACVSGRKDLFGPVVTEDPYPNNVLTPVKSRTLSHKLSHSGDGKAHQCVSQQHYQANFMSCLRRLKQITL